MNKHYILEGIYMSLLWKKLKITFLMIIVLFLLVSLVAPNALAYDEQKEITWFINLLKTNNGKSFCIPPKTTLGEISKSLASYSKSNNLPDITHGDQSTIDSLAQIYPCVVDGESIANVEFSKLAGKTVVVKSAGEYATINTKRAIEVIQKLSHTSGHENDALVKEIKNNPGNYEPPVLFALADLMYRQGKTIDAIFWLNAGRIRVMFDAERCTDISVKHNVVSGLIYKMPKGLIKAQFDNTPLLKIIIERVISWDKSTPYNYEYRWINLHGIRATNSSLGIGSKATEPLTVASDKWDAIAKKNRDDFSKQFDELIETVKKNQNK